MKHALSACLVLALALVASGREAKPLSAEAKARIARYIAELGEDEFEARELAERVLRRIGPAALPALREAAFSKDVEIRGRASRLVRAFEIEAIAGILTAPLKVRLAVKDLPASEAVARLAALSKYPIAIRGEAPAKRVTLDTGEVTFWEALDALNRAAGLREVPARAAVKGWPEAERIVLEAGAEAPTARFGSVRLRAQPAARGDLGRGLSLNVQPEPRLREFRVVPGSLRIHKAIDGHGQPLETANTPEEAPKPVGGGGVFIGGRALVLPPPPTAQRSAGFTMRPGAKPSRILRELTGTVGITAECETGIVAAITSPLTAKEKHVTGRDGWGLRLLSMKRAGDGTVEASVVVSRPTSNPLEGMFGGKVRFGGRIVINGVEVGGESERATPAHPRLYDAEGRAYTLAAVENEKVREEGPKAERRFNMKFTPPTAKSVPARMTLSAIEQSPLTVPFSFKDLTIPE
jgi:hypothetical protein